MYRGIPFNNLGGQKKQKSGNRGGRLLKGSGSNQSAKKEDRIGKYIYRLGVKGCKNFSRLFIHFKFQAFEFIICIFLSSFR